MVLAGAALGPRSVVGDQAYVRERSALGAGAVVGRGSCIENDVAIGAEVRVQSDCYVTAFSELEDDVFLGPRVTTANDRTAGRRRRTEPLRGPRLRRACRVGAGAVLLPGVEIGEEAFVGSRCRRHARCRCAHGGRGGAGAPGACGCRRGAARLVSGGSRARRLRARLRREIARIALRSEPRHAFGPEEKRTVALGVIAGSTTVAVVVTEVGRVWRRGSAPLPRDSENLLLAAEEAVAETVEAAVAGFQDVSATENAVFSLLAGFVATFASARGVAYLLRGRRRLGPFRNVTIGRRHIHHFVPGIAIAFGAGVAALFVTDEQHRARLALALGTGMGLTLDESALLLELQDVYWSPEGLLGVQITLSVAALMAALTLALRFARRGERIVLEQSDPEPGATGAPLANAAKAV